MSYYDDLGVPSVATRDDIDKAYRALAQKLHPDRNPASKLEAALQFKRVQEAYECLSNPTKRQRYDEFLASSQPNAEAEPIVVNRPMARPTPQGPTRNVPPPPFAIETKSKSLWSKPVVGVSAAAVLLLIAAAATIANKPPTEAEKAVATEAERNARAEQLKNEQELAALEVKEAELNAQSAIAIRKLTTVMVQAQRALALIEELRTEITAWGKDVLPLMTDERGKYVAASEDSTRTFAVKLKSKRPSLADAAAVAERIDLLVAPVSSELGKSRPAWQPDEALSEAIQEEMAGTELMLREAREPRQQIMALIEVGKRAGKLSDVSLEQAVTDLNAVDAASLAAIESASQQKLVEKEKEHLRDKGAQALSAIDGEIAASSKAAEEDAEFKKLLAEAGSQKTAALLRFFFTKGHLQADLTETAEKRPFSLARLEGRGCLDQTPEGQTRLLHCLCTTYEKERPTWKTTPYLTDLTDTQRTKLEEMQAALIKLGPALVELKLLDP